VQGRIDRVFVSPNLEAKFPLASVTCLPKDISDHTPLLHVSDAGNYFGSRRFKFEK
jgi:endonuclease/exonuclease/phosphatase family metal-dependent hydrolase